MAIETRTGARPDIKTRMNGRMAELLFGYPFKPEHYEITPAAQAVFARMSAMRGDEVRNGAIARADVAAGKAAEQNGPRIPGGNGNGRA